MTDYILQNYFIHNNNVVHVHLLQVDCDFEHDEWLKDSWSNDADNTISTFYPKIITFPKFHSLIVIINRSTVQVV